MQRAKPPFRADEVGSLLALGPDQGGARPARAGRHHGRGAARGRGPRDREDHQEAGGGGPAARHRRRVPPLVVASRFLLGAHGLREAPARSRHQVPWRGDQARVGAHRGQARFPVESSDARPFPVSQGPHQGDAENVHPGTAGAAFPHPQGRHSQERLSRHGRLLRRPREDLQEGGEGVPRRRLPLPAVRRYGLGLSVLAGRDEGRARTHAVGGRPSENLSGRHQCGSGRQARRHDHHDPCLPRQFPLHLGVGRRL